MKRIHMKIAYFMPVKVNSEQISGKTFVFLREKKKEENLEIAEIIGRNIWKLGEKQII